MWPFDRIPTKDKFARLYIDALFAAGQQGPFEYDPTAFRITRPGGITIFLHNAYEDYKRAQGRKGRRNCLAKYVQSNVEPPVPDDYSQARANILPLVRPKSDESLRNLAVQAAGGSMDDRRVSSLAQDLIIGLVYDRPESVVSFQDEQLQRWGIDFDRAMQQAVENLRDRTTDNFVEVAPGLFQSNWQDTYDVTRMLLTDMIYRLGLTGDPVAMIPNRNALLLCGSRDLAAQAAMFTRALAILQEPRALGTGMYRLDAGRWTPYRPEGELGHHLDALRFDDLGNQYAEAKHSLEQLFADKGDDRFIADRLVMQQSADAPRKTVVVWTRDVHALLPKADYIAFNALDVEGHTLVEWDKAMATVGRLVKPAGYEPPWFYIDGYPADEELRAMGET